MNFLFFLRRVSEKNTAACRAAVFLSPAGRLKKTEVGKQFCENIALGVPGLRQTFSVLALDLFRSSTQKVCQNLSPDIFYHTFKFIE